MIARANGTRIHSSSKSEKKEKHAWVQLIIHIVVTFLFMRILIGLWTEPESIGHKSVATIVLLWFVLHMWVTRGVKNA